MFKDVATSLLLCPPARSLITASSLAERGSPPMPSCSLTRGTDCRTNIRRTFILHITHTGRSRLSLVVNIALHAGQKETTKHPHFGQPPEASRAAPSA